MKYTWILLFLLLFFVEDTMLFTDLFRRPGYIWLLLILNHRLDSIVWYSIPDIGSDT